MTECPKAWKAAALVLAAHGSSRHPGSRLPTERLAEAIRRRGCFAEVATCYLKEPPFVGDALSLVAAETVYVVPNFAAEGDMTRRQVPTAMGLTGRVTRRGHRQIHYTEPVGSHPQIPRFLRRRVDTVLEANALAAPSVSVLLVGHGSSRPGSSATAEAIADALRHGGGYGEVLTAFLEQEPRVAAWADRVSFPHVVVAPLLIAEGLHGSEDIPPVFGLAAGEQGSAHAAGHRVWLCPGIGDSAEIADIVLDRVAACTAAAYDL